MWNNSVSLWIFFVHRNNEKRKEKSRDAARCRRSRETEIFTELSEALPVPQHDIEQLDKASIIRLAIATLKVRDMLDMCKNTIFNSSLLSIFSWRLIILFSLAVVPPVDDTAADGKSSQLKEMPIDTESLFEDINENMAMQALDGYLMVLSNDGDIVYVSENIHDYVGIQQASWKVYAFSGQVSSVTFCFFFTNRSMWWANRFGTLSINAMSMSCAKP